MSYLLDTNVVSELRKRPAVIDRHVAGWAQQAPARSQYISVVTLLEIELGILRIERRDHQQGTVLRDWMESAVLPGFANRILPISPEIALRAAQLHVPDPRPERDAFIAATAQVHGLTVVTRNTEDFLPTGVALLNPWLVR